MTKFDKNAIDLYQDLIGAGYFRDDDGSINFAIEDFMESIKDEEIVRTLYDNLINDGFYRDDAGNVILDVDTFVSNLIDKRQILDYYPLTENQRGIYIDWEMNRETEQYNIPFVDKIPAGIDAETLRQALLTVVDAHPYVKTRLAERNGEIVQLRLDDEPAVVDVFKIDNQPDAAFFQQRVRPFNLFNDRLYRLEIYDYQGALYLFQDFHHIIFDGGSYIVFLQDVSAALAGQEILTETYSAFDHAFEEHELEQSEAYSAAESYFDNLMSDFEVASYPRSSQPDSKNPSAGHIYVTIEGADIRQFCRQNGLTENSYFMSAFSEVLQRVLRQKHLFYTSITSGRVEAEMQQIVGMFVKTLPVVTCATLPENADEGKRSVKEAVQQMQRQYIDTQSNAIFPYTKIVEKTDARSEILFVYQGGLEADMDNAKSANDDLNIQLDLDVVKMPISIEIVPTGNDFKVKLEYDTSLYSSRDMELLGRMFCAFSRNCVNPQYKLMSEVPLVNQEMTAQVMKVSAGKCLDIDTTQTFACLFVEQARRTPNALAVADADSEYTYEQLDKYSDTYAHTLIDRGVKPDMFVCVMLDRTKEFPLTVLAIHKAGAAYTPLDLEYPNERLSYMIENSESPLMVTTHAILQKKMEEGGLEFGDIGILFLDDLDLTRETEPINLSTPEKLAYMIYTSGSTGKPKGVMLHQKGLRNYIASMVDVLQITGEDRISNHRPFSFDAHIQDLYPALTVGGSIHIMPSEIRKDMRGLREFIVSHRITGGSYTTSLGAMLLEAYRLPLRYMALTGEKMMGLVSGDVQLVNGYGPTECTDLISAYVLEKDRVYSDIPIGRPMANSHCFITDPTGNLLPVGVAGELCFASVQVGRGYWKLPEKTDEVFVDCPFLPNDENGHPVRMYHTGDLCRWNGEDQLEYLGRIDSQVKLRGFRIELGEIESLASGIAGIRQAVAEVKNVNDTDHLVLYYTLQDGAFLDEESIREALKSTSLAEYMIPDAYVRLDVMPLTPNGKTNRKALPLPEIKAAEMVPPANQMETELYAIASALLKTDQFGVTTNLISVGLTSLLAMRMSASIHQQLGYEINMKDLLTDSTVRHLAELAGNGQLKRSDGKVARPVLKYYPLTENQRGVYIDWEMNRGTEQYNIPSVEKMPTGIDAESLKRALLTVVDAHPYLKTRLAEREGEVVQLRLDSEPAVVDVFKTDTKPDAAFFQQRVRPFDLFNDRLYRLEIYDCNGEVYLFQDFHHIIFDGGSQVSFTQDVSDVLSGKAVEPETYSAFDRALDEHGLEQSEAYSAAESYFDGLMGDCEVASYPRSSRPDSKTPSAGLVTGLIDGTEIRRFCRRNGCTENSYFMAAFSEVLQRVLRRKRLLYTSITSGRVTAEMLRIMGMFVKTLPVVTCASVPEGADEGKRSVKESVQQMQRQYIDTQDNSIFPYTKIVEKTGLRAEILFVYQGGLEAGQETPAEDVGGNEEIQLKLDIAKMPVTVVIAPMGGDFHVDVEYDASLYSARDMELLFGMMKSYSEQAAAAEDQAVGDIALTCDEEQKKLVQLSSGDLLEYNTNETFIDLFRTHAKQQPEAIAVVDMKSRLTYAELDTLSDNIAAFLINKGVQPNDFMAIMMKRVKEFVVAVLGVQKACAAYVPVDPEYPQDRIDYMIEDSQAKFVLTEESIVEASSFKATEILPKPEPDNLAYMIYTSGSTGKPKGTMLSHRALRACMAWNCKEFELKPGKKNAHHPSFSFDASVFDIFGPLSAGAEIHIFDETIRKDMDAMTKYLVDNKITGMTMSTALGMALLNQCDLPLEYMMLGGEKFMPVKSTDVRLYNGYGPTEFTVCSSYHLIDQQKDIDIPIGRAVANSLSVICDQYGNLLPQGVPGELCLIGAQMADGYWHRPDITAERFADCKFKSLLPQFNGITLSKFYHTGDLAVWNEENELMYLSRIDNQVKLRGFRIEMGEIETVAAQYEGVKAVAADVLTVKGSQHLCLYFTADKAVVKESLRDFMAQSLTEYMIPDAFMQLDVMPMTPGGKIARKQLPVPDLSGQVEYVQPANETEQLIADTMAQVLGIKEPVGALDSFYALGGESIKAIRLVSLLRQHGLELRVAQVMKLKTVRAIADVVMEDANHLSISQEAWSGAVPNSAIVDFFFNLNLPKPNHFHQSLSAETIAPLDMNAFKGALDAIVNHHDMLRALVKDGSLFVRFADEDKLYRLFEFDCKNLNENEISETILKKGTEIRSTFDIQNEGMMRVAVFHLSNRDVLLMVIHHLVIDGVSWRIIKEDLADSYKALAQNKPVQLPQKTHSYRDYCEALRKWHSSPMAKQENAYWQRQRQAMDKESSSAGNDYSRQFAKTTLQIDEKHTDLLLHKSSTAYNTGINDLLLTALGRSYFKLTGNRSLSVQLEGHGREQFDKDLAIDRTIGWFTSTYPVLLHDLGSDLRHDIRNVKESLHAIPNNGFGYSQLFGVNIEGMPLVSFNYLGEMDAEQTEESFFVPTSYRTGLDISEKNTFGASVNLNGSVTDGVLSFEMNYDKSVLPDEFADSFVQLFVSEIAAIAEHCAAATSTEITASDLGETAWSDDEFQSVCNSFGKHGETLQRIYPLTPMQEGMLLAYITNPDTEAYRMQTAFSMKALPTREQLETVMELVAQQYETLRTSIIFHDVQEYRQAILDRKLPVRMVDISNEAKPEVAFLHVMEKDRKAKFDIQHDALFHLVCAKTGEKSCYLSLFMHHIIVDGWCLPLINDAFLKALHHVMLNVEIQPFTVKPGQYESFVRELKSKDFDASLDYWKNLLTGYSTKAIVPKDKNIPAKERSLKASHAIEIDGETVKKLQTFCKDESLTINSVLELTWGLVLQTYNRTDDAVFVKVVSGRSGTSQNVENVVGLFINSIPVRVRTSSDMTVCEAVRQVCTQASESNEHDFCPLSEIQQQSELGMDLFQSILAFENYPTNDDKDVANPLGIEPFEVVEPNINEITIAAYSDDNRMTILMKFANDMYRDDTIKRTLRMMKNILCNIAENPYCKISELSLLTNDETEALVELGKGKELNFDTSETLPSILREKAKEYADNTLLVFENRQYTFRQADEITERLARYLKSIGLQHEQAVGVMIERSELMFIYSMAVMKAGGTYMPLDSHFPEDRLMFMCEDADVRIILTDDGLASHILPSYKGQIIRRPELQWAFDNEDKYADVRLPEIKPEDRMVILFTSGSTGKPKGVELEQHGIVNYCHWYVHEYEMSASDRAVGYANYGFDAHMIDIYPIMLAGASVYIMPEDMRLDLMAMSKYIDQNKLTIAFFTTQIGCQLVQMFDLKTMRLLSTGGEKMPPITPPNFRFINPYGPTECSLFSTIYDVKTYFEGEYIGCAIDNYQLYIVDSQGNLVPEGVPGELLIAGTGVARGYLNRPELTAQKFVDFRGQKAYHSGDLVRWAIDPYDGSHQIEFLGRIDGQVKLRGLRIELGEIENRILSFNGIRQVCVAVIEMAGTQNLCAYFTAERLIDVDQLRSYIKEALAEFMVPAAFIQMDKLPLNANGKVDRKALPLPEVSVNLECVAPASRKEQILLEIAQNLMKRDDFGVTDDLFSLGMTSLLSIKMVASSAKLGIVLKVGEMMKERNIRAMLSTTGSSWAGPYDPQKKNVVFIHGMTAYSDTKDYIDGLQREFNVYVIEDLRDHFDYLFLEADMQEVVETYYMLLDTFLEGYGEVVAFTGHCFGGEIAYRLAVLWSQRKGNTPVVQLLDTYWTRFNKYPTALDKMLQVIPDDVKDFINNSANGETIEQFSKMTRIAGQDLRSPEVPDFQGKVILFRAMEHAIDSNYQQLLSALDALGKDISIIPKPIMDEYEADCNRVVDNEAFWIEMHPGVIVHHVQGSHMGMLAEKYVHEYVTSLVSNV